MYEQINYFIEKKYTVFFVSLRYIYKFKLGNAILNFPTKIMTMNVCTYRYNIE